MAATKAKDYEELQKVLLTGESVWVKQVSFFALQKAVSLQPQ
jgi:hypothetical protein